MASSIKLSSDRQINRACLQLLRLGWSFRRTGKHPVIKSPCGMKRFTVPKTPSDSHSVRNFFADLKRAGVEVPA